MTQESKACAQCGSLIIRTRRHGDKRWAKQTACSHKCANLLRSNTRETALTKFSRNDGCWEWDGDMDSHGYGSISIDDRRYIAHRLVYEQLVGPIPAGLVLDHLCINPQCVRPDHLEPVTQLINTRRALALRDLSETASTCPAGHPKTEENAYRFRRWLQCRICNREAQRRRSARRRSA